jgi:TrpR-related protein YerC/YecD
MSSPKKTFSLAEALLSLKTTEELQDFLQDLCTPAEWQSLQERWKVCQLLDQKQNYRNIHERTKTSLTTITRVARFLKYGSPLGYRLALDRLQGST